MPIDTLILSGALVASGLYITYLHWRYNRLRRWSIMASYALEASLDALLEKADEDTSS